jgi:hypothetical protein
LKENEKCPICVATLEEACNRYDSKYCEIKEKYMTDPNMGADDVVNELSKIMTPQQKKEIADALIAKGAGTPS